MKKHLLSICLTLFISVNLFGQLVQIKQPIINDLPVKNTLGKINSRSATNPKSCKGDTSYFPNLGTTQYQTLSIGTGQGLGQFYGAPTEITVSGFRFYGFLIYDTARKVTKTTIKCRIYKAGADSLPTGSPLATTVIQIDTIQGLLYLSRMTRNVVFTSPVVCNFPYIITVESDSTNSRPGIVSNSWSNGDGDYRNLAVGSVSGKWYRCLQLNIGGISFNSHMQLYPFVKYKFGTDFTSNINCYNATDTIRLTNLFKGSVNGSVFYNYYHYYEELGYGYDKYCHNWVINNSNYFYNTVDLKYKPASKVNLDIELRSMVVSYASGVCWDTTTKTVEFRPVTPSLLKPANGCIGDTLKIGISGDAGSTLNWYHKITDSKPFNLGNSYVVNNLQKADTFAVLATNGSCTSGFLTINLSANKYPTKITTRNDSLCSSATANLIASADNGQIDWYNTSTGGTKVYTGNTLTTSKLYSDTSFYVTANNNGCAYKGSRILVKAFVGSSFAPPLPTVVTDTTVCFTSAKNYTLSASTTSGNTCRWYDVALGGKPISTGNTYSISINNRGASTYYVESWNGNCGSGRTPVNILAAKYPPTFVKKNATICAGDSAKISASTMWGNIDWYLDKTTNTSFSSEKFLTLGGLTNPKNYIYFKTRDTVCVNPNFDSVLVTVNTFPKVTKELHKDVCQKSLGELGVELPSGNVYWYEDDQTVTVYATGKTVSLGQMWSNITLYYQTEANGCYSPKTPLTINALPRPTAGFTWTLAWPRKVSCVPITTTGMTFKWYWGDGANTSGLGVNAKHQYTDEGDYVIKLVTTSTTNGCTDTADIPVSVSHLNTTNVSNPAVKIYPNPAQIANTLTISGINVTEIKWYDISGREIAIEKVIENNTVIPSKLSQGLYFIQGRNKDQVFKATIQIQ